ncbi:iron ABC transporter permease [Rhizobium sp.]|jgi:iron complex transport system permease protein|uniref:FecCD family ABC transporter permease n=1 Tax=Rhizobium sp. TaxID=391 RepID=UPI000E83599B|nr:iron ABC transporter [Rhizobium sp.]
MVVALSHVPEAEASRTARHSRALLAKGCLLFLVLLLLASALVSLTAGASDVLTGQVLAHYLGLSRAVEARDVLIIEQIRLPRVFLGMLVGAALAVSGTIMQGMFRNPLADPGLAGVSAGAGLGAAIVIVLGGSVALPFIGFAGFLALPLVAFLGSLLTTASLYHVSTRNGRTSVATMLLAGIAFGALAMAATGCLVYMANDNQIRDLTFWQLGSLAGATWAKVATLGALVALSLTALPFMARGLNGLSMGEAVAGHMGVHVEALKKIGIVIVSVLTGGAVSMSGGIGFVGIVVPHVLRLAIGPDHRFLLPASALLGAALLVLADALARTIVAPAELPIGIITALFGSPFFLWLLLKRRNLLDM